MILFKDWFSGKFEFYSYQEAADLIGCSRSNVQNWKKGNAPSFFWAVQICRAVAYIDNRNFTEVLLEMSELEL